MKFFVLLKAQVLFHETTLGQPSGILMIVDVSLITMTQRQHHDWVTETENLAQWSVSSERPTFQGEITSPKAWESL